VALASRGQRDMDRGPESITDEAELAAVRAQARTIHLQAAVVTFVVTAVVVGV
jgi:hypothetical protein